MRILVTGGTGFIGSNLVNKLLQQGHKVAVYDAKLSFINNPKYFKAALNHRKKIFNQKSHLEIKADIRNNKSLEMAFKNFKPDVVVHLAGLPMARPLKEFEALMVPINMQGTLNVLDEFEKSRSAKKLIYTSSSMSYGHFKQNPQGEDSRLHPINSYGATKAAGEYFVKLSKKQWTIVRPTSIYGYTDCANRVTQLLLDAALNNKKAWVVKGESLDFSYIEDVTDGFIKCIESEKAIGETFNISRGESRPATDFAKILKKYFPQFEIDVREPSNQQVWRGALDISKAKRLLKFKPKYNIEKGIEEILKYVKNNKWVEEAYKEK